jgi:hypothetical protein
MDIFSIPSGALNAVGAPNKPRRGAAKAGGEPAVLGPCLRLSLASRFCFFSRLRFAMLSLDLDMIKPPCRAVVLERLPVD